MMSMITVPAITCNLSKGDQILHKAEIFTYTGMSKFMYKDHEKQYIFVRDNLHALLLSAGIQVKKVLPLVKLDEIKNGQEFHTGSEILTKCAIVDNLGHLTIPSNAAIGVDKEKNIVYCIYNNTDVYKV